jgi:hypothetical protein
MYKIGVCKEVFEVLLYKTQLGCNINPEALICISYISILLRAIKQGFRESFVNRSNYPSPDLLLLWKASTNMYYTERQKTKREAKKMTLTAQSRVY